MNNYLWNVLIQEYRKKIGGTISITKENVPAQRQPTKIRESASNYVPKNAIATSAVALGQHLQMEDTTFPNVHSTAAPDVEMNIVSPSNQIIQYNNIDDIIDAQKNRELSLTPTLVTNTECRSPKTDQEKTSVIGCNSLHQTEIHDTDSLDFTESDSNESFIMETTFSLDNNQKSPHFSSDKHKDPDLMLKSVERLTQEFVSSAEQSRFSGSNEMNYQNKIQHMAKNSIADTTSSTSNNTWNEDTCPNDVSFPSVSVTAPIVGILNYTGSDDDEETTDVSHKDLNDFAEITPTNEEQPAPSLGIICDVDICAQQPYSIDTETDTTTLVNGNYVKTNEIIEVTQTKSGINFMLGGKVQTAAATCPSSAFLNTTMQHSAIIAMEARDLAENFLQTYDDTNDLTYSISSIDLDNIRPPSCMDSLNISGYYQDSLINGVTQPNSIQKSQQKANPMSPNISANSPKFPKKSLPFGIVARRALGQLPSGFSGSAESVISSCNLLDNIKPPSLMDELLDSMMSVASIQSEIADCESLATTLSLSNYETAAGGGGDIEIDENTVTLLSCCDIMPHDDNDEEVSIDCETLLPSDNDYTSAESTPRKHSTNGVKRTLTPKQKRKLAKDRYKTYTIAADIVLNQNQCDIDNPEEDERIQIEVEENTFVIDTNFQNFDSSVQHNLTKISENMNSAEEAHVTNGVYTNGLPDNILIKDMRNHMINTTGLTVECEYNSLEHEQNSETESCHGLDTNLSHNGLDIIKLNIIDGNCNDINVRNSARIIKPKQLDQDSHSNIKENIEFDKVKAIRGRKKPTYVSPYRMQFVRNAGTRSPTKNTSSPVSTQAPKFTKVTGTNSAASTKSNEYSTKSNQPLERQGTFVKDEPSVTSVQVPIVGSTTGKQNNLSPSRLSKLPTKKQISSPSKNVVKPNTIARKLPVSHIAKNVNLVKTNSKTISTTPQRSNSNASLRITSSAARNAVLSSRISTTTPPSRSNSNLNVVPIKTCSATSSTAPLSVKISQAQSRIAGIWKKVDEAKTKQPKTKSPEATFKSQSVQHNNAIISTKQKLVRGTTFDTSIEPVPKLQTAQIPSAKSPHTNLHNETRKVIKNSSIQSKIAVNKSSLTVISKENIASRK